MNTSNTQEQQTTETATLTDANLGSLLVGITTTQSNVIPVEKKSIREEMRIGAKLAPYVPENFEQAYALAKAIAKAGWAPKSYQDESGALSPEKIAIGILHGLEVGLTPMSALQSIAVINGTPSLWGDGALAVVRASGLLVDILEEPILEDVGVKGGPVETKVVGYRCTATRKGQPTPIVREFTQEMANKAGLLSKKGPWQEYRSRMYMMRSRAWALRDGFADALRGLSIVEEVQDIPTEQRVPLPGKRHATAKAALDDFASTHQSDNQPKEKPNDVEHETGGTGAA